MTDGNGFVKKYLKQEQAASPAPQKKTPRDRGGFFFML
jgi:hypothetical protein